MSYRLYKKEKLCSVTAIDRLFAARPAKGAITHDGKGRIGVDLCYPLRMVYGENPERGGADVQFLISVPKKRLRRAVDRVKMRRRIREAYRLSRPTPAPRDSGTNCGPGTTRDNGTNCEPGTTRDSGTTVKVDVAFIYVADELVPYDRVERAMRRLLPTLYRL